VTQVTALESGVLRFRVNPTPESVLRFAGLAHREFVKLLQGPARAQLLA
jgi:hypothetical protein